MAAVLIGLLVVPSLQLSQPVLRGPSRCGPFRLSEASVAEPAEEIAEAPVAVEAPATVEAPAAVTPEDEIRSIATKWMAADEGTRIAMLSKLGEFKFDTSPDVAAYKSNLVGSWNLLLASDSQKAVTGCAPEWYSSVLGQTQTFRKPDPMAIFAGNKGALSLLNHRARTCLFSDAPCCTAPFPHIGRGARLLGDCGSDRQREERFFVDGRPQRWLLRQRRSQRRRVLWYARVWRRGP